MADDIYDRCCQDDEGMAVEPEGGLGAAFFAGIMVIVVIAVSGILIVTDTHAPPTRAEYIQRCAAHHRRDVCAAAWEILHEEHQDR